MAALNSQRPSLRLPAWLLLGSLIVFAFGLTRDTVALSRNASTVVFIAFIWLVIQLIRLGLHKLEESVALNTLPPLPAAVAPAGDDFQEQLAPVSRRVPELANSPMKFVENTRKLQEHGAYLDECQQKAGEIIGRAITRYRSDAKVLEQQQLALARMGDKAARVVRKIESSFPRIRGDLAAVPKPTPVTAPIAPSYIDGVEYARYVDGITGNSGQVLGRGAVQLGQGNWQAALFALAATAVVNVVMFQKQVRALADAHGQVDTFVIQTRSRIAELARTHAELQRRSAALADQNSELHGLLTWFKDHRSEWSGQGTLRPDVEDKTKKLARYAQTHAIDAQRKL